MPAAFLLTFISVVLLLEDDTLRHLIRGVKETDLLPQHHSSLYLTEELGARFHQKITVGLMKLMHLQLPLDTITDAITILYLSLMVQVCIIVTGAAYCCLLLPNVKGL